MEIFIENEKIDLNSDSEDNSQDESSSNQLSDQDATRYETKSKFYDLRTPRPPKIIDPDGLVCIAKLSEVLDNPNLLNWKDELSNNYLKYSL